MDQLAGVDAGGTTITVVPPSPVLPVAPVVGDEALALQAAGGGGDAHPAHPEQVSQILVGDMKAGGVRAVLGHQQPARQPWANGVEAVACCQAGALCHQHIQIPVDALLQCGAVLEQSAKRIGRHPPGMPRTLHHGMQRLLGHAERQLGPQHSFAPHHAHLQDQAPIELRDLGNETIHRKIGKTRRTGRTAQHLGHHQRNLLAMRKETLALRKRQ